MEYECILFVRNAFLRSYEKSLLAAATLAVGVVEKLDNSQSATVGYVSFRNDARVR